MSLFCVAALTLTPIVLRSDAPSQESHTWINKLVDFITDKNFYSQFPQSTVSERFRNLLRPSSLRVADSQVTGKDSARGIMWLRADLEPSGDSYRLNEVFIVVSPANAAGQDTYPLLLASIERHLRTPGWKAVHKTDLTVWQDTENPPHSVSLSRTELQLPFHDLPNKGPWVIIRIKREEGDSEP